MNYNFLTDENKKIIKDHARANAGIEVCGLFIKMPDKIFAYECKNIAPRPQKRFNISPFDYIKAAEFGKIIGCYHSHTEQSSASEFDKFNSIRNSLEYIIFCRKDGMFYYINPNNNIKKYIDIKFEIGATDCFTIIKKFYLNELKIDLGEYYRDKNWKINCPGIFDNNYKMGGFDKVLNHYDESQLKIYDCLLFKRQGDEYSSHIGLYLGNNMMLHQQVDSLSSIIDIGNIYKKGVNLVIRHNKVNG